MARKYFYHVLSSHADYRTHAKDGQHEIFRRISKALTGQERRQKQQNNCTADAAEGRTGIASPAPRRSFPSVTSGNVIGCYSSGCSSESLTE